MNAYFLKMNKEDKNNILDQHKKLYDGYQTIYNKESNLTPLYVQDLANDKEGITVNNKGNVSGYKNIGINEQVLDTIGDGSNDLKNGTVDLGSENIKYPSPNEDEEEYITFGIMDEMEDNDSIEEKEPFEYDIDEMDDFFVDEFKESLIDDKLQGFDEIDEDILPEFMERVNESLDMFKRFKNFN